ncbi:MAG: hypothetical protein AAFQ45_12205 [Pseudomonadota bacterium]
MSSIQSKATLAASALLAGAFVIAVSASVASAAAPKCKTSVGSSNKHTCTTDYTAKQKGGTYKRAVRIGGAKAFKAKLPPCPKIPRGPCKKRR